MVAAVALKTYLMTAIEVMNGKYVRFLQGLNFLGLITDWTGNTFRLFLLDELTLDSNFIFAPVPPKQSARSGGAPLLQKACAGGLLQERLITKLPTS
jgi:hypothetical protein